MSADRFAPASYEDYICRGMTAREVLEYREREKQREAILAMAADTIQKLGGRRNRIRNLRRFMM